MKNSMVGDVGLRLGDLRFVSLHSLGPYIIYDDLEKVHVITDWFKTTYSQQKFYANNSRRDLELEVGDVV